MEEIYVVGVGMTRFDRQPERTLKELVAESVNEALQDAGATKEDLGAAFFGNVAQGVLEGQTTVPGQVALRAMGIDKIPVVNVENACATASTAFHLAVAYLKSGLTDIVLAVGAEKLCVEDKKKVLSIYDGGWDVSTKEENLAKLLALGEGIEVPDVDGYRSVFMDIYAAWTRGHMRDFGTTQEQLAIISAKNHYHSTFNPKAQFTKEMSVEEVLKGRALSYPLTVPMCSPISDGGAAAVLCTKEGLRRLGSSRPVKVCSSILVSGSDRPGANWHQHVGRRASAAAYEQAGIGPKDISVAEVHDATAFGELLQSEMLGFCELGQGGIFAASGATRLGGQLPINPSGGLESKGHPLGATGLGQIYELVTQLRGEAGKRQVENARFGMAENGGAVIEYEEAAMCVTILGKN